MKCQSFADLYRIYQDIRGGPWAVAGRFAGFVTCFTEDVTMNKSDGVDLALELLPRPLVRAFVITFCVALAFHLPDAQRLVLWYVNDKAQGIVETITDSIDPPTSRSVPTGMD